MTLLIRMESRGVLLEERVTHRGTHVEMFQGPYGIACYMDGLIQSSEADEGIYHGALVQPICRTHPKRVMIIGGGEGATAREVLKGSMVETVDMYEWDKDVVQMFQSSYPQWAKGAWDDPRLTIYPENIMDAIATPPDRPYDAIIIDLFDPSEENIPLWTHLFSQLHRWTHTGTSVVMYTGEEEGTMRLMKLLLEHPMGRGKRILSYDAEIPCFEGECTFLLIYGA